MTPARLTPEDVLALREAVNRHPRNEGHGHVFPRPDGMRARCGGPAMCAECAFDLRRSEAVLFRERVPALLSILDAAEQAREALRYALVALRMRVPAAEWEATKEWRAALAQLDEVLPRAEPTGGAAFLDSITPEDRETTGELLAEAEKPAKCQRCGGRGHVPDYMTASIRTDTLPPQIPCPDCQKRNRKEAGR